jgi:hypothetical protein
MRTRVHLHLAGAIAIVLALSGGSSAQEQPAGDDAPDTPDATDDATHDATADVPMPDEDGEPGDGEPGDGEGDGAAAGDAPPVDKQVATVNNPLSLRSLARRLDAIAARGEQLRGRVDVLKNAVLEGGRSASATITHRNKMGDQFRLTKMTYTIDGIQVFNQRDETGALDDKKTVDILRGPIAPGNHTIAVTMVYRGHGYGPFKYLNKQTFTVKGSQTFKAVEGKAIKVDVLGFERKDVPLEQRPAVSFKVSQPK